MLIAPRAPFAGWVPHFSDDRVGHGWYLGSAGAFLSQTQVTRATADGATVLSGWVDTCLERDRERIDAMGGLFIFHDFRSIETYEAEARLVMTERIKARPRGYSRQTVLLIQATPLVKMAMQVANVAMAVTGGKGMRMIHDLDAAKPFLRGLRAEPIPSWARTAGAVR